MIFFVGQTRSPLMALPEFVCTGAYELVDEGVVGGSRNWHIRVLADSGITFSKLYTAIDVCAVGGGGGGSTYVYGQASGAGGGGGYVATKANVQPTIGQKYNIYIGQGGSAAPLNGNRGGTTAGFSCSAAGGYGGNGYAGGNGGSGGGAAGAGANGSSGVGGSNGGNGGNGTGAAGVTGGAGSGTPTTAFYGLAGDIGDNTLYGAGGAGARVYYVNNQNGGATGGGSVTNGVGGNGQLNTGAGGSGSGKNDTSVSAGNGASGIFIIRNHRTA